MKKTILKKVKPMANFVIVTADKHTKEECAAMNGGIIRADLEDTLKEMQTVVACSLNAENIGLQPGMKIVFNYNAYAQITRPKDKYRAPDPNSMQKEIPDEYHGTKVNYNFKTIDLEGIPHLVLRTTDIDFIIEEMEEVEETKESSIFMPDEPNIIVKENTIIH